MIKKIIAMLTAITLIACGFSAFALEVSFTDVGNDHWAKSAISELVAMGTVNGFPDGTFAPGGTVTTDQFEKMITGVWTTDTPSPISREGALEMLWEYNERPTGYNVPSIITSQMDNTNAAAWGYATGLMRGNDSIDLRPDDTLTRAEAATLIIRSKNLTESKSFFEVIDEKVLKTVWDVYGIFKGEYVASEKIDAKALFDAAVRLGEIRNPSFEVKSATIEDAALILSHASALQTKTSITAKSVEGVSNKYGKTAQIHAAYSFEKGLTLPGDASAIATKKDIAFILLQLDVIFGRGGFQIEKDMSRYPKNAGDFAFIIKNTPVMVYTTPFGVKGKPAESYSFTFNYQTPFKAFLASMSDKINSKAEFKFIPSLVCEDSKEAVLRVECTMANGVKAYDVFGAGFEYAGDVFYMDIHTGEPVMNTYIPTETAKFGKFVCNK